MKILIMAESFGYGPIITALNVATELKKLNDVYLDFIGKGTALEQAKMSNYFDSFIVCDLNDDNDLIKYEESFKVYDAILSSDTLNGTIFLIKKSYKNVYYIDNLMWMWDEIPEELCNVKKYIISETIPSEYNFERIGKQIKNPMFVGPIRNIKTKVSCNVDDRKMIINIGGTESFLLDPQTILTFYNKLINYILLNNKVKQLDKIIVCGGSNVINNIILEEENKNVIIKTLSNEDYLSEMESSKFCVMASGLGNFIETIGLNKNIMYLPAINYSQLQQIEYYESQNFGFNIINWSDFEYFNEIPKYLDEATGVKLVTENIEKFNKGNYKKLVDYKINEYFMNNQDEFFNIRTEYTLKLDKNASKKIAKEIYNSK